MITPSQITDHLQRTLWRFTDIFNTSLTVTNQIVIDARTIRITTSTAHGLSTGKYVISKNGLSENAIVGVTQVGSNLEFETAYTHDLTNADGPLDDINLTLTGFTDSEYNTSFNIQTITAQNKFQIINPLATVPTLNGNELLLENRSLGVNGFFEVTNIVSSTVFDMEINTKHPDIPLTGVRDIEIIKAARISVAASAERADAMYTKQTSNKAWLFVIMGDTDASKDRHTLSDAVRDATYQDDMRQKFIQQFETHVYLPTDNQLSGYDAQELAYDTIFKALINALFGALFTDDYSRQNLLTVSNGHGPGLYNTAYYTHVYSWQQPTQITFDLGIQGKIIEDVAFRKMDTTLKPFDTDQTDGFEFTNNYL